MMERKDVIAIAICKSRKFETGQGTCAAICMDQLGYVRARGCPHACSVHASLASQIDKALDDN